MATEPPDQGAPQPGSERDTGPAEEEAASLERLREVTRALASRLTPASLPNEPISPDAVRELAADLAAQLLAGTAPVPDVQGFMLPYQCTGAEYKCDGYYKCIGTHSCTNVHRCTSVFSTSVYSGRSLGFA